ncbi:MAG: hypothetical protein M4579_007070 [Chaenotheca gracillima]|nr:MAG: hypothetical protein M4579_007070 [Chaenotheca gracillima]
MASIRVETFSGTAGEDVSTFIQTCKFAFMPMAVHYPEPQDKVEAQILMLVTNTTGEARQFINTLDSEVRGNWVKLTDALKERFESKASSLDEDSAYDALANLKQGSRSLKEYFEEARRIRRILPTEDRRVAKNMVRGLKNDLHRSITSGILVTNRQQTTLANTIEIVRNVAGENDSDLQSAETTEGEYAGIEPRDRKFLQLMALHEKGRQKRDDNREDKIATLIESIAKLSIGNGNGNGNQNARYQAPTPNTSRPYQSGGQTTARNQASRGPQLQTCYRCGQQGHYAPQCANQALSPDEQKRVRETVEARIRNRPVNPQPPMATAASNVETQPDAIPLDDELQQEREGNQSESYLVEGFTNDQEEITTILAEIDAAEKRTGEQADLDSSAGPSTKRGRVSAPAKTPVRTPPQSRSIQGMKGQNAFDLWATIRNCEVKMSLMNLMDVAPKMRAEMGKALSLQPKGPTTQTWTPGQTVRFAEGSAVGTEQQEGSPPVDLWVPNFYTEGYVRKNDSSNQTYVAARVLIDGGSTINLISDSAVTKMRLPKLTAESPVTIHVANGHKERLADLCTFLLTVGGVEKNVLAYIVPGNPTYTILLGRGWMKEVHAIGDYATGQYFIKPSEEGEVRKLSAITPQTPVRTPRLESKRSLLTKIRDLSDDTMHALENGDEEKAENLMRALAEGWDISSEGVILDPGKENHL